MLQFVIENPAARIESSVGRLQSQWATMLLMRFILSCMRVSFGSSERTCHEDERSARSEDPVQLSEGAGLVIHAAEHERAYSDVEAVVLKREVFGRRPQHLCRRGKLVPPPLQAPDHRLARLGQGQCGEVIAVVAEVGAGASANLQHVAPQPRKQLLAMRRETACSVFAVKRSYIAANSRSPRLIVISPVGFIVPAGTGCCDLRGRLSAPTARHMRRLPHLSVRGGGFLG